MLTRPLLLLEVSYRRAPVRIRRRRSGRVITVPPTARLSRFDAAADKAARERAFLRRAG